MSHGKRLATIRTALVLATLATAWALSGCPQTPDLVIFHDPLTPSEHARLGAIYEREGKMDRATEEYVAALKKAPDNLVALTGMGNIALSRDRPRVAARYYARALRVDRDNMVILNNLAMAWLSAGKPDKALAFADRAVELDRAGDPRVLDTRAQVRLARGDREGAVSDLETASSLCKSACRTTESGEGCDPARARSCEQIAARLERFAIRH